MLHCVAPEMFSSFLRASGNTGYHVGQRRAEGNKAKRPLAVPGTSFGNRRLPWLLAKCALEIGPSRSTRAWRFCYANFIRSLPRNVGHAQTLRHAYSSFGLWSCLPNWKIVQTRHLFPNEESLTSSKITPRKGKCEEAHGLKEAQGLFGKSEKEQRVHHREPQNIIDHVIIVVVTNCDC